MSNFVRNSSTSYYMNKDAFITILNAGFWETPPSSVSFGILDNRNWNELIILAQKHNVVSIFYDGILLLPKEYQPQQKLMRNLLIYVMNNEKTYVQINEVLKDFTRLLTQQNIPSVLLKGQGIANEYLHPNHRTCGDIDLYVGEKLYKQACQIVDTLDIDTELGIQESVKHLHFTWRETDIEIHHRTASMLNPLWNRRFNRWSEETLFQTALPLYLDGEKTDVQIPSQEFNVTYIYEHMFNHFMSSGVGFRQLCDWACTLHRAAGHIDSNQLKKRLKSFGLYHSWRQFGYFMVHYMGLPPSEFPLYESRSQSKADKIWEYIAVNGDFGKYLTKDQRPEGFFQGKVFSLRNQLKLLAKRYSIFPYESLFFIPSMFYSIYWAFVQLWQKINNKKGK